MRVRELMSAPPVAVPPEMGLRELTALLTEHEISGAPVVEGGRVVGVVSASDVVERERGPDPLSRRRLLRGRRHEQRPAAYAATVGDAMKSPPITIQPWMSVYEAAWLMSFYDVNRLPVVERGELVGVVSRADLVRYFARSDHDIEQDVREKIQLLEAPRITVTADHGRVRLEGELQSPLELACLPHLVSCVPGVVDVESTVTLSAASHATEAKPVA